MLEGTLGLTQSFQEVQLAVRAVLSRVGVRIRASCLVSLDNSCPL